MKILDTDTNASSYLLKKMQILKVFIGDWLGY